MPLAAMPPTPDLKRLLAALLVSGLLHLGLALLAGLSGGDPRAGRAAPAAAVLTARLLAPAGKSGPPAQAAQPAPEPAPASASPSQAPDSARTAREQTPAPVRLPSRSAYPLGPVDLDIPEARLPTVQGTLRIKLWIDETGRVTAVEPDPTDLPTEYVSAVGEVLSAVRFAPALKEGQPVASVLRLEINVEAQP